MGLVLFLLTFGVEQYYRYHVSNLRSLDGKEHHYYIYPDMSVDSVLNIVRKDYEISGETDLRWHMRLSVLAETKPGYYVFPAEMGDKLFITKLQSGDRNIDEFAIFEQALPAAMVQEYYNASPVGDEMGLMAYLPFEEQKLNPNGILEQVFSVNDRREFRDANGNVVEKVVPLVLGRLDNLGHLGSLDNLADKANFAPTSDKGTTSWRPSSRNWRCSVRTC